jgi:hypothetical protein
MSPKLSGFFMNVLEKKQCLRNCLVFFTNVSNVSNCSEDTDKNRRQKRHEQVKRRQKRHSKLFGDILDNFKFLETKYRDQFFFKKKKINYR